VGLLGHVAQVHNKTVEQAFDYVCGLLTDPFYQQACYDIVEFIGPTIIKLFEKFYTPDVICMSLDQCASTPSGQPVCHLFPRRQPKDDQRDELSKAQSIVNELRKQLNVISLPAFCKWPGVEYFCKLFEKVFDSHLPLADVDKDGFSTSETLRGYAWRGRDCNDQRLDFHPGARPVDNDVNMDSNCNGIKGIDTQSNHSYEELLCSNSHPRGIVLLGDSVGAHFSIPPQFLHAPNLTRDVFSHLPYVLSNELDWPMLSSATGFMNLTWSIVDDRTVSVYDLLRSRNRCNHRDYQNLGYNGADSKNLRSHWDSIRRNQIADYPVLLIYEIVGNDI
jgi:acyloxyacyl hydrolase